MDEAVAGAFHAIYFHGGQCCTAGSRLFVEEKIRDEFVERLADKAKKRKVGDPLDPTTEQGPQVSQEQLDKILGYVDIGQKQGAKLVAGGKRVGAARATSSSRRSSTTSRTRWPSPRTKSSARSSACCRSRTSTK